MRCSVPGWEDMGARSCKFLFILPRMLPNGLDSNKETGLAKIALLTRTPAYPLFAAVLTHGCKMPRTKELCAYRQATADAKVLETGKLTSLFEVPLPPFRRDGCP